MAIVWILATLETHFSLDSRREPIFNHIKIYLRPWIKIVRWNLSFSLDLSRGITNKENLLARLTWDPPASKARSFTCFPKSSSKLFNWIRTIMISCSWHHVAFLKWQRFILLIPFWFWLCLLLDLAAGLFFIISHRWSILYKMFRVVQFRMGHHHRRLWTRQVFFFCVLIIVYTFLYVQTPGSVLRLRLWVDWME